MTNNKIAVLGADGYINQIPRIKEGLRVKPLEYLCEDFDLDILEEAK